MASEVAILEKTNNELHRDLTQDTEIESLFNDMNALERHLFYDSFKDPEVRHELLWSGPSSVIADFRDLIQIILIVRVIHLAIDLYPLSNKWKDIISCLGGIYLLHAFISKINDNPSHGDFLVKYTLSVIFYYSSIYYAMRKMISISCDTNYKSGPKMYLVSLSVVAMPILLNEYLIHQQSRIYLSALRSIFMTISMKVFSQIYDDAENQNVLSALGYFLHPASCLFGPWHQCSITQRLPETPRPREIIVGEFFRQSINALSVFALALLILLASASLLDLLDTFLSVELGCLKQVSSIYLAAMKFRFSHYFMCYLSKGLLTLWQNPTTSPVSTSEICQIIKIEWPRSLLEVVRFWNIPMSNWLRDHIFVPSRAMTSSNATAVLTTFAMSALFHGFKFNIWSVLLSLGVLTLIEYEVRRKLAEKLGACISAKRCSLSARDQRQCLKGHNRTELNSNIVFSINLSFRLLAMVHLAYLGYIFQGNTDMNTYRDDIGAWSELYFFSPILASITLMLGVSL